MRKKSVSGKPAKGKKSRTAKAAPRKSVGDLLFHSNLADILKDRESMAEDTALKAFPKEMQRLKKMGIQIPADSGVNLLIGAALSEQLSLLTAEMRTVRQLIEAGIVAKTASSDAESEAILRRLEEKLRAK